MRKQPAFTPLTIFEPILKSAFSVIELIVVLSIIFLFSSFALFGFAKSRTDEGLKADYLEFYEDIKAAKLRANLGKIAPTTPPVSTLTTMHKISFVVNSTQYTIDGVNKIFKNGSRITQVIINSSTYTSGSFTIYFVPDANYLGPTLVVGNRFITSGSTGSTTARIKIAKTGTNVVYYFRLIGEGYNINKIEKL